MPVIKLVSNYTNINVIKMARNQIGKGNNHKVIIVYNRGDIAQFRFGRHEWNQLGCGVEWQTMGSQTEGENERSQHNSTPPTTPILLGKKRLLHFTEFLTSLCLTGIQSAVKRLMETATCRKKTG
jgi:hypothetical protein